MKTKAGTTIFFAVEGAGQFPFDMLRYDSCYPAASDDAARMDGMERRTVVLAKTLRERQTTQAPITVDRWASFGWIVKGTPPVVGRMPWPSLLAQRIVHDNRHSAELG